MSSRAIAEMCGVSHMTVQRMMPEQLEYCSSSTRLGRDGKERHLPQPRDPAQEPEGKEDKPETKRARPCFGMKHARVAIMALEQIEKNDDERFAAMDHVEHWISDWRERHQEKEGGAAA